MYVPRARVLDGVQGRANGLCIGTFVERVSILDGPRVVLSGLFPPQLYAVVFAFISMAYAAESRPPTTTPEMTLRSRWSP
jgi:hypothetical protein